MQLVRRIRGGRQLWRVLFFVAWLGFSVLVIVVPGMRSPVAIIVHGLFAAVACVWAIQDLRARGLERVPISQLNRHAQTGSALELLAVALCAITMVLSIIA